MKIWSLAMKKVVSAEKYNVAWFKLAECVSRGEKERALGVYRLLSHSINDTAIQQQLEGDLFLAFNDVPKAIKRYEHAIELYKNNKRLLEAIAVYEHLLTLDEKNADYRVAIIGLYSKMKITNKVSHHGIKLIEQLLHESKIDQAIIIASQVELQCDVNDSAQAYQSILFSIIAIPGVPHETIQFCLQKTIDLLIASTDESLLQQCMSKLEVADVQWYQEAKRYVTK